MGVSSPLPALLFLAICLTIPELAWGQQVTAAITGRITDPSDLAIAGVKVEAKDNWPTRSHCGTGIIISAVQRRFRKTVGLWSQILELDPRVYFFVQNEDFFIGNNRHLKSDVFCDVS